VITRASRWRRIATLDSIAASRSWNVTGLDGKEEVDGSSPSEGSAKTPEIHVSLF
jgi:hypothetical protein